MSARQCPLGVVTSLQRANYYADIEVCGESGQVFVLAADLVVEVYDLSGRYLGVIRDFADLFSTSAEIATTAELPILGMAWRSLILADPLSGTVALYSLESKRILFAKNLDILPFSIAGASSRRDALISCGRTGALYRLEVETADIVLFATGGPGSPPLLGAAKDRWIAVDTSTAIMTVHEPGQDVSKKVSLWPAALRRDEKPPGNGHWVFGVDCSCDEKVVIVLHGRGGKLIPSFWSVNSDSLNLQEFIINQDYEAVRVAVIPDQRGLFLCVNDRSQYSLCASNTLAHR